MATPKNLQVPNKQETRQLSKIERALKRNKKEIDGEGDELYGEL